MKEKYKIILSISIILIVSLILYWNPLFSNKPLGLDALGHISKVSYLKEFGLNVQWDQAWYNGAPFLQYYSPLYYQVNYFFKNIIFGSNFLSFLSILLTSGGIFFLIKYYTKKNLLSLIFALFFLTILCTSYYYVSVGNHPYVFALFTIPFTLLFLEKSLNKKNHNFILYAFFFLLAYLSHIFIALCLFLLVFIRLIFYLIFNKKKKFISNFLKENIIFLGIPLFLSAFWFLPFLSKTQSFIGDAIGYIPSYSHLLGFGDYLIWGIAPGEIGILFGIFLLSTLLLIKFIKNEEVLYLGISSILFLFLLRGILGEFYPTGVGAIRFILPFSILICIFCGTIISKSFKKNKKIILLIGILLIIALILNFNMINKNYTKYSYHSKYSRYGFAEELYSSGEFPLKNEFTNYRFGTPTYIFSETLTYKFPALSQTGGYFDQGVLYPGSYWKTKETIWNSENLSSTITALDNWGIKYFEIGGENLQFDKKFNDTRFSLILNKKIADYSFKLYEYKKAKPIISIIQKNGSYKKYSDYKIERNSPDKIIIEYDFYEDEKILIKEFFHDSWRAKDFLSKKEIKIKETNENWMELTPPVNTKKVLVYQSKTCLEKVGIILSLITIIIIIGISQKEKLLKFAKSSIFSHNTNIKKEP